MQVNSLFYPIKIFFSYSHKDEEFRNQLVKRLNFLRHQGFILEWHDHRINAQKELISDIDDHILSSQIILFLISDEFLESDYYYGDELNIAMERHESEEALVIPIYLRPVEWHNTFFNRLNILPQNAKPVSEWKNPDAAFYNISEGLRVSIEDFTRQANFPPVQKEQKYGLYKQKLRELQLPASTYFAHSGMPKLKESAIDVSSRTEMTPLPGLLDKYDYFIEELLKELNQRHVNQYEKSGIFIMDVLRKLFGVDLVYYAESKQNHSQIIFESKSMHFADNLTAVEFNNKLRSMNPDVFKHDSPHGMFMPLDIPVLKNEYCVIVPIINHITFSIIVLYGFSEEKKNNIENVIGTILNSLYKVSDGFHKLKPEKVIRSAIYDGIKGVYKFVSPGMYDKRFNAFCESLVDVDIYFQPIVHLANSEEDIYIKSWEALARDKKTKKIPVELFKAAELWGIQFQTQIDMVCLRRALESYIPQTRRRNERAPLSVNVYPDSITSPTFRNELKKLVQETLLSDDDSVIFEISEKILISSLNLDGGLAHNLDEFRGFMEDLSSSFGIQFAIDDFGVGYSSISRLNRLLPSYVKIDRDVLHYEHKLGMQVIRYLHSLRNIAIVGGIRVIVEGIDNKSNISLSEMVNKLNVRYAQGFLFGLAQPKITRLENQKRSEIARLVKMT